MNPDLTYYFGLYLVTDLSGKTVVRKLQEFESPYISLMRADPGNKIMVGQRGREREREREEEEEEEEE